MFWLLLPAHSAALAALQFLLFSNCTMLSPTCALVKYQAVQAIPTLSVLLIAAHLSITYFVLLLYSLVAPPLHPVEVKIYFYVV